jgi:threonine/homoserine/homoserine lactone efflux protein
LDRGPDHPGQVQHAPTDLLRGGSMTDTVMILAGLAVFGVLVLGYVGWRTKRRKEDAKREVTPEDPDQQAKGGGGPRPKK